MASPAEKKLRKILGKVLLLEESKLSNDLSRDDLEEWDSLAHLMLISEIESGFEVTLTDDDIMAIRTVGDLRKVLRKLGVGI